MKFEQTEENFYKRMGKLKEEDPMAFSRLMQKIAKEPGGPLKLKHMKERYGIE